MTLLNSEVKFGKNSQRIYANTNREEDANKFLTITDCILTSEAVNDYNGAQIAEKYHQDFNIDKNKIYKIYRPLVEIEKAKDTYNLKALTDDHIAITPDSPAQHRTLGTTGESARIEGRDLLNTVAIWNGKGKKYIEDADLGKPDGKKDLSCGYAYELLNEPGIFDGIPYDFKMVNLRGNHVALVKKGRVDGAQIADSIDDNKGVHKVKKKVSGLMAALSSYFNDSAVKDNSEKMKDNEKILKAMKEVAGRDASEFEGGEDEQGKTILEMAKNMHDMDPDDDAEDEEEEEEAEIKVKKECAKDGFEKEPKEPEAAKALKKVVADNEEATSNIKAKDKLMDSMALDALIEKKVNEKFKIRAGVHNLCEKVVGKLSDELLMDSNLENVIDNTLRLRGVSYAGKSAETKIAMLELLANQNNRTNKNMLQDSAPVYNSSKKPSNISIFNAMKGK